MKIRWTPQAEQDRGEVWDFIASDNPQAAERMDQLFSDAVGRLVDHPKSGHAGKIAGTRELIAHENYRLVYEVEEDANTAWVLALVHTSRLWPPMKA